VCKKRTASSSTSLPPTHTHIAACWKLTGESPFGHTLANIHHSERKRGVYSISLWTIRQFHASVQFSQRRLKMNAAQVQDERERDIWRGLECINKRRLAISNSRNETHIINTHIVLSEGWSCRCKARENPKRLPGWPFFLRTFCVSRLNALVEVHMSNEKTHRFRESPSSKSSITCN